MDGWSLTKLIDFIDFNPYENLQKGTIAKKVAMEQLLPFTRDISSYELAPFNGGSKFCNGDTLMARITPCLENGKTAKVNILDDGEIGFGSTEFIVLRAKPGISDSDFIYYLATSPLLRDKAIKSMVGSSGRQRVQQGVLNDIEFLAPPFDEQVEIGQTLRALDDKIANNTAINHHLEQMAQAIFKSWFVDFEQVKSFTEVVQVLGGGTPKTTTAEYWHGSIPFFTPKDAIGLYVLTTEKSLSEIGLNNCNSQLYPANTVFVTARGTVGKLVMAGVPMAMNQSCYALVGNDGYGQHFVYHLALKTIEHLKHKASGAVFDAIVIRDFDSEIVVVPPIEDVKSFENKVKPIYEAILNNENESAHLATLRDTLLPRMVSGELSVADLAIK